MALVIALTAAAAALAAGGVGYARWRRRRAAGAELDRLRTEVARRRERESAQHIELLQLRRDRAHLSQGAAFSRAVFEASLAGLLVIDPATGQIMDANRAAGDILGRDPDDLLGRPAAVDLGLDPSSLDPALPTAPMELRLRHAEGGERHVMASLQAIPGDQNDLVVFGFVDITRRRAAESELRLSHEALARAHADLQRHKDQMVQSEKLASIGQLAAGVAHEINNPIGFVTSNLGTIREYCDDLGGILALYAERDALPATDAPGRARLDAAIAAARSEADLDYVLQDLADVTEESLAGVGRVADIVQNLKSFAREDSGAAAPFDLDATVEAMIQMSWNELKYRCEVVREFGDVPPLRGHAGRIGQVVMNMLVNAAQAMPAAGGRVTVGTTVVGDEAVVTIADTGGGIAPEHLPRIFDPFFTTKEVGSGTGLGLSISHGIVQDHGGAIDVASTPGAGTTFRIRLPLAPVDGPAGAEPPGGASTPEMIG